MKKLIFFFVLTLSISLVSAVSIQLDGTDFSSGDIVPILITGCVGDSVLQVFNPDPAIIKVDQGINDWTSEYNTNSDPGKGKYQFSVNCADGTSSTTDFCVGQDGCAVSEEEPIPIPTGGGGGGGGGTPKWDCQTWSYCNITLQRERTCFDQKYIASAKREVEECEECEVSWICSEWSECMQGKNARICRDEHKCETTRLKPHEDKLCAQTQAPGPAPKKTTLEIPRPKTPQIQKPVPQLSLWDKYKTWIITIPSALLLITVIVLLILHFHKPHHVAYNVDELKNWIKKEREMGTSDNDVREILRDKTGWNDQEINEAFSELT